MESETIKTMKANGKYDSYAFPGGYDILYLCADGGILCADCANENFELTNDPNDEQWFIIDTFINYEDTDLFCYHCYKELEPEYGED